MSKCTLYNCIPSMARHEFRANLRHTVRQPTRVNVKSYTNSRFSRYYYSLSVYIYFYIFLLAIHVINLNKVGQPSIKDLAYTIEPVKVNHLKRNCFIF